MRGITARVAETNDIELGAGLGIENRDAAEVVPTELPEPIKFESQREFVRDVLRNEVNLRARGKDFVDI